MNVAIGSRYVFAAVGAILYPEFSLSFFFQAVGTASGRYACIYRLDSIRFIF